MNTYLRSFLRLGILFIAISAAQPVLAQGLLGALDPLRETPESQAQIQLSFAPLVKEAAPAVVNVYTQRRVRARTSIFDDPFFRGFGGGFGMPRERMEGSLGSGVIVRPDGIIVTNNHVVQGADELKVVLSDRREYNAEILLADPRTDVAVLKVLGLERELPSLPVGTSEGAEVGDLVLAIGNPFGVGQTTTSGIISALGRSDVGVNDYSFFIQTDAAINPGNSGGALIDMNGRLIGVNTAIYSRSGGSNGIGFAIPAELVSRIVENAVEGGELVRPWLGASGQSVTADLARSLGLDRPAGMLVNRLWPGGPADRAGLRVGDVVLQIDGVEVNNEQAARFRLATRRLDDRAALRVWRNGALQTLSIVIEPPQENPPRALRVIAGRNPLAGAEVANLSPAFSDELGVDPFARGIIVTGVQRGSWANRIGFRRGDIIRGVDEIVPEDTDDLADILRASDDNGEWFFQVERNGRLIEQPIRLR